jgi:hypothetical protein
VTGPAGKRSTVLPGSAGGCGEDIKRKEEPTGSCKWGHAKIYVSEKFAATGVVNLEAGKRFSFNEVMTVKAAN